MSAKLHITKEQGNDIIKRWKGRATAQGYRGKTRYSKAMEFYCGAMSSMSALGFELPPMLVLPLIGQREPEEVK